MRGSGSRNATSLHTVTVYSRIYILQGSCVTLFGAKIRSVRTRILVQELLEIIPILNLNIVTTNVKGQVCFMST